MAKQTKDTNRYHHGDLRNALLQAGIDILDEKGMKGLTLRACAARAGVSHAAPTHHFGNMKNLLTALATIAHQRLQKNLLREFNKSGTPPEKLRAISRGYIIFAAENPGIFRLMFNLEDLNCENEELVNAGKKSFGALQDAIAHAETHLKKDICEDNLHIALMIWSTLHGYSHLMLEGQFSNYASDVESYIAMAPDIVGLLMKEK